MWQHFLHRLLCNIIRAEFQLEFLLLVLKTLRLSFVSLYTFFSLNLSVNSKNLYVKLDDFDACQDMYAYTWYDWRATVLYIIPVVWSFWNQVFAK